MAILRVSDQNELTQAIRDVRSGDTILLAAGTYDELYMPANSWNPNLRFNEKVTIASADPDNPAVLNKLTVRSVPNLHLRDLEFDYAPSKSDDNPFWIESGRNIYIVDCTFEGNLGGNGYGTGVGLRIKSSQNVTLEDSTLSDFRNGVFVSDSSDVDIIYNDFRGMSNDSMLLGGITGMLIRGNDLRAMNSDPNLEHKDVIQFYTSNVDTASRDIVIRGNTINNPEQTHGIFFTNAVANAGKLDVIYRNLLVEDNYIRSAHSHGVTVNHGDGVTIRDNEIVQNPDLGYTAPVNVPRINVSTLSRNVTITGNDVASVQPEAHSSWTVANNRTTRKMDHWTGSEATAADDGGGGGGGGGNGEGGGGTALTFRVDGRKLDAAVEGVDFARGDVIVFNFFEAGTLEHVRDLNPIDVWDNGGGAKVDTLLDLVEIVDASDAVTAQTLAEADTLLLRIAQSGGAGDVAIAGFGAAYDALI